MSDWFKKNTAPKMELYMVTAKIVNTWGMTTWAYYKGPKEEVIENAQLMEEVVQEAINGKIDSRVQIFGKTTISTLLLESFTVRCRPCTDYELINHST